ncbi:hypothetical protein JTE90_015810, partial [Oedothorax gibbosus]
VLEAVQLGELFCGYGYGPARKLHYSLGFSGPTGAPDRTAKTRCFYENSVPISDDRFHGHELLTRKDNSSPVLRRVSEFVAYELGPKDRISVSGLGNINAHSLFGSQANKHTRHVFAFSADVSLSELISSDPLGPTDPCFNNLLCAQWNPFSSFSPSRSPTESFATTQDLHRWPAQVGLTPAP